MQPAVAAAAWRPTPTGGALSSETPPSTQVNLSVRPPVCLSLVASSCLVFIPGLAPLCHRHFSVSPRPRALASSLFPPLCRHSLLLVSLPHHRAMCHRHLWRVETQSHILIMEMILITEMEPQEVAQLTAGRKHLDMQLIDCYNPETGFVSWHHVRVAPFTAELTREAHGKAESVGTYGRSRP